MGNELMIQGPRPTAGVLIVLHSLFTGEYGKPVSHEFSGHRIRP
jgi:hypothetical protein